MSVQLSCELRVDEKAQLGSQEPATLWERASVDVLPLGVLPTV